MRTRSAKVTKLPVAAPEPKSLLDMTLRALLERVLDNAASDDFEWVNIRDERYPWKHIVEAAERGECEVSRVGRKLLMQRGELNKFMKRRLIGCPANKRQVDEPSEKSQYEEAVKRTLRKNGLLA